jgi:hypothetical protein
MSAYCESRFPKTMSPGNSRTPITSTGSRPRAYRGIRLDRA